MTVHKRERLASSRNTMASIVLLFPPDPQTNLAITLLFWLDVNEVLSLFPQAKFLSHDQINGKIALWDET